MSFLERFYSSPDKLFSLDKMNTGYIHSFNNLVKPIVELNVIRKYERFKSNRYLSSIFRRSNPKQLLNSIEEIFFAVTRGRSYYQSLNLEYNGRIFSRIEYYWP